MDLVLSNLSLLCPSGVLVHSNRIVARFLLTDGDEHELLISENSENHNPVYFPFTKAPHIQHFLRSDGQVISLRPTPSNSTLRLQRSGSPTNEGPPKVQKPSAESTIDQFQPQTGSERELQKLLCGKDDQIDLALVNWLIAVDIPEFQDLTRQDYFKQLDAMIEQVRQEVARMQQVAVARGESLKDANTRCAIFCNAIIKLRLAYAEAFRQENVTPALLRSLYVDPNNICLAGLLRTRRGSCVSMPLIYLVIGQRLGVPVHLVAIGRHYFIRWEEQGYRMNIEPTIVDSVSVTPDDSVYMEIEGLSREQLTGSDLRNLTRREVVGHLLFARSAYWATKGQEHSSQQRYDLSRARQLAPDDQAISKSYEAVFNRVGIKQPPTSIKSQPKEQNGNPI